MARMIPANLLLETESTAEERLFYALRDSLDDSHTVFHSFDLPVRNLQNKLIDVEIDFLIFQQKQGLLTLEVKGGSINERGQPWKVEFKKKVGLGDGVKKLKTSDKTPR